MINYIRKKLGGTLYIQIWEKRIKVTSVTTRKCFDEQPLVAIETTPNGSRAILAVGNSAASCHGDNVEIINPFSHPRVLFSDFHVGEKLLQHVFYLLLGRSFLSPRPVAIVHPMEKLDGGLTMIEKRAFREVALGAGASEVYLYIGQPLSLANLNMTEIMGNQYE